MAAAADNTAILLQQAFERYVLIYGEKPNLAVFAPGRVNLIGEHTDYNDGFVMPFAIPFKTVVVGSRVFSDGSITRINSTYSGETDVVDFEINTRMTKGTPLWANYVKGTIAQYVDDLPPQFAFNACIASDVPVGSGLSSSAALEVAIATFIERLCGGIPSVNGVQKALRCQKAEHVFADTPCGIMDQFISSMGKEGNLLLIDCRSQEYKLIPFGKGSESPVLIVTNSNVKHKLSGSEYPDRVRMCKEAVAIISKKYCQVKALRDVTMLMLEDCRSDMDEVTFKRAKHSVTEDLRTLDTVKALEVGDFVKVGENMTQSHVSLRDEFEVSCVELDCLVEIALNIPGVYGSRMTGGGFGGCTITLVKKSAVDKLVDALQTEYAEKFGKDCFVYAPMNPSPGCGTLSLEGMNYPSESKSSYDSMLSWITPIAVITLAVGLGIVMSRKK